MTVLTLGPYQESQTPTTWGVGLIVKELLQSTSRIYRVVQKSDNAVLILR